MTFNEWYPVHKQENKAPATVYNHGFLYQQKIFVNCCISSLTTHKFYLFSYVLSVKPLEND